LKAGGKHIFTVPAILTRQTRYRSIRGENGQERRLLPPSYHGCTRATKSEDYLVRCEFGGDSLRLIDELGFKTKLYYRNVLHLSDPNFVFVSTKV
jgi:hypothetical protein